MESSMLFTRPRHIYHLAQASLWTGNEHAYLPPTHDADGFIHCAAIANSLVDIANCFYTAVDGDFVCIVIDTHKLPEGVSVKWEPPMAVGGTASKQSSSRLLPHVYGGTFGSRAVVSTLPVVRRDDGTFLSISGVHATPCDAVVWDCDGTLINTEPLWKRAESHVFGSIGMPYTEADGKHTTGLRIDAVVDHWATTRGWDDMTSPGRTPSDVTAALVAKMAELIAAEGTPMPGVHAAIELCRRAGVKLAVASSSPRVLIMASLKALGLENTFEVVASSEDEEIGKPHPATYLTAARLLGVSPTRCLAIEDSMNGLLSAKSARMRVIAVPDMSDGEPPRRSFGVADVVLPSLEHFDELVFHAACTLG